MNYKVKQTWALLFTVLLVLFMYLKRLVEVYSRDGIHQAMVAKRMLLSKFHSLYEKNCDSNVYRKMR
jgi:hypothetical protein